MQLLENVIITMTKKVFLIDDEPDITYTLEKVLEDNGFKVDTFNDPVLALNYYKVNFYDLVILDIKMPKMDGFELYIKIREKNPKVKICFSTALTMFKEDFRKRRLEMGKTINENYFIIKPIKTEDLVKKLTSIMNI
jgi:DNA-binding response OmpR family regulator